MVKNEKLFSFLNQNFLFILITMGLVQLAVYWPGEMTPDSYGQYSAAVSGAYSDHHPPVMSFVWRYLDMVVKGSGLMLLLHLILLYTGLFFAAKTLQKHPKRFLFMLFPLVPPLLIYTHYIWKDIGFAYSFVCVGGVLAWVSSRESRLSFKLAVPLLVILFYGASVKYQAQFLAPVFLAWMVHLMLPNVNKRTWLVGSLLLITAFSLTLHQTNETLTKEAGKNHSWQFVKLYDLAAISVALDKPLFPEFVMTEYYTQEKLHEKYSPYYIDELAFPADAILRIGKTQEERDLIWSTWAREIMAHPFHYMKHRFSNLAYVLLSTPGFLYYLELLDKVAEKDTGLYKTLYVVGRVLGYLFMAHILTVLLCFFYIGLALKTLRTTWAAKPLLAFNITGFLMVVMLLFLSMAGTPRYTYITICMVHLSHFWAYLCYKAYKREKTYQALGEQIGDRVSI